MRYALRCLGFAVGLLAIAPSALAETRQWTDSTGKHKIEAEFVELSGGVVKLRNPQGKTLSIPLNKLSAPDRKFAMELAAPAQVAGDSATLLNSLVRVIVTLDPAAVTSEEGDAPDKPEEITLVGFAIQTGEPGPVIVLSNRNFPRGIDPADIKAALATPKLMALRADTEFGLAGTETTPTDEGMGLIERGAPVRVDPRGGPVGIPAGVPAGAPVGVIGGAPIGVIAGDAGGESGDEPPRRFTAADIANAPLELTLIRASAGAKIPLLKLAAEPPTAGAKALVTKLPAPRVGGARTPIVWTSWSILESEDPGTEFNLQPNDGQYPYIGATLPVLNDKREVVGVLNPGIKTLRDKRRAASAAGTEELQAALASAGITPAPAAGVSPGLLAGGDATAAGEDRELSVAEIYLLQAKNLLAKGMASAANSSTPPVADTPPEPDPPTEETVGSYGRPAIDTPAPMSDPRGGIGAGNAAAWRNDYTSLTSAITSAPNATGGYDIVWGDAAEFGAWYDAARQAVKARGEATASGGRDPAFSERAAQAEQAAAEALTRLGDIVWTATVNSIDATSGRPSDVALPPLPEPLRMSYFVDPADAGNWASVQPGGTIRFTPRFSITEASDYPGITVHMTLVEAMAR